MNRREATLSTNLILVNNLFCSFALFVPNLFCSGAIVIGVQNLFYSGAIVIGVQNLFCSWKFKYKCTLFNRERLYALCSRPTYLSDKL